MQADSTAETPFEQLSIAASNDRLRRALASLDREHARPSVRPTRTRHACTPRTRRKLSVSMAARRKAEALLANPTKVCALRLKANLTQRAAADRALINERTWHRAERDLDTVSASTLRRVAHALGVAPNNLR
jgi:DNA-binding XRE family transcriptional regulator